MTDQLAREVPPYTFNVGPGEAQIDLPLAAVHGGSNSTFGVTESADLFVWGRSPDKMASVRAWWLR